MKIKLAHVQVLPKMSGAQQISFDIMKSLDSLTYEKFLICGSGVGEKDFIKIFEEIGVTVILIPELQRNISLKDIRAFIELYRTFKKYKFDIVHTNSTKPGIVARIAAKCAGVKKIIHTVHGIAFHSHVKLYVRYIYWAIEYVSCFFGDVNVLVNNYYKKYYPGINNVIIYNGIDFSNFKKRESKNIKDKIHFAYLARLDEQKNPLEFIEAVDKLKKMEPFVLRKARFSLAGDGDLASECRSLIKKLNLEKEVSMPGWIRDKSSFYNDVDVLCQPSRWEAFGLVFAEAAFFHIPAISRKVEGIPEIVIDERTGYLYSGGADDLALIMKKIINEPEMINSLGENAFDYAMKNFTLQKMVHLYQGLYRQ